MRIPVLISLVLLGLQSCLRPPDYPLEPVIGFVRMSKDSMMQNQFNTDSLQITLSFTDGDGDIGRESGEFDLYLTDTRDNFSPPAYRLPKVPEQGIGNGISGEISFVVFTTCCYFPNGLDPCSPSTEFPVDTLRYQIYLKDRAGRQSNLLLTPPIRLLCR